MEKLLGRFLHRKKKDHCLPVKESRAWKPKQGLEFHTLQNGFFLFKFSSYNDSQQVHEGGPWFVNGHPLVLKRWTEEFTLQKEGLTSISIWFKFPNLKMTWTSISRLSKLESSIRNPLCMDKLTAEETRLAFARILVKVSAESTLTSFQLIAKALFSNRRLEYGWKPSAIWVHFL